MGFSLRIGGSEYSGWLSATVQRAIDQAAGQFSCTVTEAWAGNNQRWPIRAGDACEIRLDGELVLTGYVDAYEPSYDAASHTVTVSGRSKTADLVDSSVVIEGGQVKGATLGEVAERVAAPFGVAVDTAAAPAAPIADVQVNQGETVHELVDRLSAVQGVLVSDTPRGDLAFVRPGAGRARTPLKQGGNILSATATLNDSERFSSYTVKAQHSNATDRDDPAAEVESPNGDSAPVGGGPAGVTTIAPTATVEDKGVTRTRPLVIIAETQATAEECRIRAETEARRRIAQAVKAQITVQGWHQDPTEPKSPLWQPNNLVEVSSPFLGIQGDMLIAGVQYLIDESGSTTVLALTLQGAFAPDPPEASTDPATGKRKKKTKKTAAPETESPDTDGDPAFDDPEIE